MAETNTYNIALWGPPAAGKTMYLAQLYLRSHHEGAEWKVHAEGPALAFVNENRALLDNQNRFIPPTPPGTSDQKVLYTFCHKETHRELQLAIDDRAGGDWLLMDKKEEMQKLYGDAAGLVLLFDCMAHGKKIRSEVLRTLEGVRVALKGKDDNRPVALCLSKADNLVTTPARREQAEADPDGFMRTWLEEKVGKYFVEEVGDFFSNCRLFPVSSIGVHFAYGVRQPVVFIDERFEQRLRFGQELKPINLFAPFTWIFEELEGRHGK